MEDKINPDLAQLLPNSSALPEQVADKAEAPVFLNRRDRRELARRERQEAGAAKHVNKLKRTIERKQQKQKQTFSGRLRAKITSKNSVEFTKKHNRAWDEVNQCAAMLYSMLSVSVSLHPVLNRVELTKHYPDAGYVSRTTLALVSELVSLFKTFNAIRQRHAGKIGRAANVDDQLLAYQLYNDYMIVLEKYNASGARLFEVVTEQIQVAIEHYRAENGDDSSKKLSDELRAEVSNAVARVHGARHAINNPPALEPEAEEELEETAAEAVE